MVSYATVHACRRKQLLNYFGEKWPKDGEDSEQKCVKDNCCDICAGEVESVDATQDAQIIMSAMARTGERFGISHVVAVVTGDYSDRIRQLGHDRIKTFGVGSDRDRRHWRLMIDNLLAQGLIQQTSGEYRVLKLQAESKEVLFGGREVHVLKTRKIAGKRRRASIGDEPYDEDLFSTLRALRKRLADEQGVPPYVVFSDRTLHQLCRVFPSTQIEMMSVSGVGEAKLARYGETFTAAIREYVENRSDSGAVNG